jgi:thiamine pyrophosphate-dependent acetolactate synthase large subunit-like protein
MRINRLADNSLFPAGFISFASIIEMIFFRVLVLMMMNLIAWFFFAEDHPLYLGCCALSANDYVHCCIEKADLIINVGHDVVEKPPFIMRYVIKSLNDLVRMI